MPYIYGDIRRRGTFITACHWVHGLRAACLNSYDCERPLMQTINVIHVRACELIRDTRARVSWCWLAPRVASVELHYVKKLSEPSKTRNDPRVVRGKACYVQLQDGTDGTQRNTSGVPWTKRAANRYKKTKEMFARVSILRKIYRDLAVQQVKNFTADTAQCQFPAIQSQFTNKLEFLDSSSYNAIPIYSYLSANQAAPRDSQLDEKTLTKMYRDMVTISVLDKILYESQRQGRISFYMSNTGEEATQIGSAAALTTQDIVYAQYREAGVLLWRGYTLPEFMNQCYGNYKDPGKGRQMPVHYGSKELNFMTISSPLTTQLPQAVGAAYAMKRSGKKSCLICYFGEGAASEGDAHAAFNFAATLDSPVIFLCRNNGYAISTPSQEQFRGDGIAARGPAYGIRTIRVDGNDVLAMYHATKAARDFCLEHGKPVLIEAMTYRIGHHSTSDDSTAYRSSEEIAQWSKHTPIVRFRQYLESLGLWCEQREKELLDSTKRNILAEFSAAEKRLKPSWKELFTDVYQDMPDHVRKQMSAMERHIEQYSEHYPVKSFKPT